MMAYREDQGRLARMAAFWSLALLLLFGCTFLHTVLIGNFESLERRIGDIRIPIVSVDLNGAFLISGGVFLIGVISLWLWQQKPKVADLLIDTEAEMRKVTWPTGGEVVNASAIVLLCVFLLGLFLAGADYILARVMKYFLFGTI